MYIAQCYSSTRRTLLFGDEAGSKHYSSVDETRQIIFGMLHIMWSDSPVGVLLERARTACIADCCCGKYAISFQKWIDGAYWKGQILLRTRNPP